MDRYLIFDESGNLGSSGRYFVISCIDTINFKSIYNIMKRKIYEAQLLFPELALLHSHEIKAKDAYPAVKEHLLKCIVSKELTISYIVADLKHVKPALLKDKNILYNYLMKLLVERLIGCKDNGGTINIVYDNHSTKIGSKNALEEYIRLDLLYEKGYDIDLRFKSMDSDSKDAYHIQAADYVANALYTYYEYANDTYYDYIFSSFNKQIHFPTAHFGVN